MSSSETAARKTAAKTAVNSGEKRITKKICDWSKGDLRQHFHQLQAIVERPKYACLKCGRAAAAKKWLCKPKELG